MDGKHIRMIKPNNSGSLFFNYKEFFSIVLFAVVDADYRFIYIDVGAYGKECDSTIFQNSTLYEHIQRNQIILPHPEPLSSTRSEDMPFVFVADEAFGLSPYIMRIVEGTWPHQNVCLIILIIKKQSLINPTVLDHPSRAEESSFFEEK